MKLIFKSYYERSRGALRATGSRGTRQKRPLCTHCRTGSNLWCLKLAFENERLIFLHFGQPQKTNTVLITI
jgi:hypothetical protein